jgi:hypothetical protein
MFTFKFLEGNPGTAFAQLYSFVITEATAKKFFGGEKNVIGKTVKVNNEQEYIITGVIKIYHKIRLCNLNGWRHMKL